MSGNNNQTDPAIVLIMLIAFLGGLGWLFWHASGFFLTDHFFRWLRFGELWPIHMVTGRYGSCMDWLRFTPVGNVTPAPEIIDLTNRCFGPAYLSQIVNPARYYQMTMAPLNDLGSVAFGFYRWPLSAAFVWVAYKTMFLLPNDKFKTKHSLESLIKVQAKMWPIISPIVKFNPSKFGRILGSVVPDKLPPFAEALSPEEWVSWHRISVVNGIPDRDASRRAFIRQLGPRWRGIGSLPVHIRALLAAFALKGAQKREDSDALLGRLALAWSPETGFRPSAELIAEIEKVLRDPEVGGQIVPIADQHAWRTTALLGVLRWARANGGVLAPAQFLWVRAEDRALWYPLNNLGRRSFHSEGAGAMAHFMAEEAAKKPLPIPRVDTAIITLNTYLHDPDKRPVPIPPREETAKA